MRFNAIAGFVGTVALVSTLSSLSVAEEKERSGGRSEHSDRGRGGDEGRNGDRNDKGDRGSGKGGRHQDGDRKGKGDDWGKGGERGDHKGRDYDKGHGDEDWSEKGDRGDRGSKGKTFRTNRGREYYDCDIIGRDPHGVTFRHRGGVAKLAFADLPRAEQIVYNYDRDDARDFVKKHTPVKIVCPPRRVIAPPSNAVREGALAARPRGRGQGYGVRNPYSLNGPITNIAAYGSVFGGYMQPYFAGSYGTPQLVTSVPGGFFTPDTLRVGGRPIVDSPIAPGMTSYSQVRDARAGAVRASVRATPTRYGIAVPMRGHSGGGHRGGHRK